MYEAPKDLSRGQFDLGDKSNASEQPPVYLKYSTSTVYLKVSFKILNNLKEVSIKLAFLKATSGSFGHEVLVVPR